MSYCFSFYYSDCTYTKLIMQQTQMKNNQNTWKQTNPNTPEPTVYTTTSNIYNLNGSLKLNWG